MAAGLPRGPFGRFVLVAATLVFFFSFAHYIGVVPDSVRLTTSTPEKPNEIPVEQKTKKPEHEPEPEHGKPPLDFSSSPQCIPELDHLKKLGLTGNIKFTRRCIKPVFSTSAPQSSPADPNAGGVDRDVVANITQPLLASSPVAVNLLSCDSIADDYIPCEPLKLAVPDPYPERAGQYDHLLFAVATSSSRLADAKAHFAHWMADSGSPLIALITDRPDDEAGQTQEALELEQAATTWPALVDDFAASGIHLLPVRPHSPDHSVPQSHMMVILDMLAHVRARRMAAAEYADEGVEAPTQNHADGTHWLAILDDDTFLPAVEPLSAALAAYDHAAPAYLGDLSESFAATRFGMAAFGGAGIFLSVPLAEELEPHLEGCLSGRGGDMQLMECVHDHTHARLERVKGLQQQDMHGNMDGFFESGWRFLTLHHWKSWYEKPVLDLARVALICGGCFLQRWRFPDFDSVPRNGTEDGAGDSEDGLDVSKAEVVFTNGYSISRYPNGAPRLDQMEGTWEGAETKDYRWSLGPIRPKLDKEDKMTWNLVETVTDEKTGGMTQIYVFKDDAGKDPVDEVIELVWDPSS
ncbi:hypothetical protein Daus18300_009315 [Diaporthe australafricana]|uniref:Glycosyltransferase family 31 protein n=1 Tax=Diaporthe australafricana TaxID=127596 RepID=A0ABR3WEU5_9PEZI